MDARMVKVFPDLIQTKKAPETRSGCISVGHLTFLLVHGGVSATAYRRFLAPKCVAETPNRMHGF